ncbi:KilA-N domain-containing protein [Methylobacterium nodulans]|uniref:KilA domain protein n=1 Tax=Methylobacterium nodulans (strain LMG 21967 / CNCM I-2342 / ORS 2060) TaxID=460265 RepID=B8IKW0_METNO|nr:KilA-N domain-containing protein [Methylobacterium nodulans]ACL58148.1 KilA domain protein [Methylobacterium nodulans ORS 2060]
MTDRTDTSGRWPGASLQVLDYNGHIIHERGETLSLTDMRRAAGADPSRQPAEWLRSADAKRFLSFLADVLNLGNTQYGIVRVVRGGKSPGTWAYWQVAMAYAKYLDPAFHAWCNEVVRQHMEAMHNPAIEAPTERRPGLSPQSARDVGAIVKRGLHANVPEILDANALGCRSG